MFVFAPEADAMPIHTPSHAPTTISNHPPSAAGHDAHHVERLSVAPLATEIHRSPSRHGQRPVAVFLGLMFGVLAVYSALPWVTLKGSPTVGAPPDEQAMPAMPVAQEVPPPLTPKSEPNAEAPAPEAIAPDAEPPYALEFDESSARQALRHRAKIASVCPRLWMGSVPILVTFSAAGVSTAAHVVPKAVAGTSAARCVEAKLLGVTIPAFRGKPRTVTLSVTL
jgi:hypothetical protein